MSDPEWYSDTPPPAHRIGTVGWVLVVLRGVPLALVVFGGLLVLLLVRLVEAPVFGLHRPWTPFITKSVCRIALAILSMGYSVQGAPMDHPGALVANHGSWLDIFALNASARVYFVSKSEVAAWPGIGWLARATGTVFIKRDRREAAAQRDVFETRLGAGHRLAFFPEGTSTDSTVVLPFKPTLFAAFFTDGLRDMMWVQPVTIRYFAPEGQDKRFYGWWGDMDFGPHLMSTLAARRQGRVQIMYHTPHPVADYEGRKVLAKACEDAVRSGMAG